MSIADAQFQKLQRMVEDGLRESAPRTIEQEDRIALETMILELEGPDALAKYQRRKMHHLKLAELPPKERAIIERERASQRDFPRPATGGIYAPRTADHENSGPDVDSVGRDRTSYQDCPTGRCRI